MTVIIFWTVVIFGSAVVALGIGALCVLHDVRDELRDINANTRQQVDVFRRVMGDG